MLISGFTAIDRPPQACHTRPREGRRRMAQLHEAWQLRNTLASALEQAIDWVGHELADATAADLIDFCGSFYPGRAGSPEWVATFEYLVDQLWLRCDPAVLAEVEQAFRARGPVWAPIANALT